MKKTCDIATLDCACSDDNKRSEHNAIRRSLLFILVGLLLFLVTAVIIFLIRVGHASPLNVSGITAPGFFAVILSVITICMTGYSVSYTHLRAHETRHDLV